MRSWSTLLRSLVNRDGTRSANVWIVALRFSALIVGSNLKMKLLFPRDHGPMKRTQYFAKWSRSMAPRIGAQLLQPYREELESNAGKDGIITWTLTSAKRNGAQKKTRSFWQCILNMATNGAKLPKLFPEELTMPLRTASIQNLKDTPHLHQWVPQKEVKIL